MKISILRLWLAGAIVVGLAARVQAQASAQSQSNPPTQPPAQTLAQACPGQDVAKHQTANVFNSITDGQPTAPWQPQITAILSRDFGEKEFPYQFSIAEGFVKSGFWCQAQFGLNAPTLAVGDSLIDFERSVTLNWLQRWHIDDGRTPTVSTLVAVEQPYDEPGEKTDLVITGIVVKSTSWGAVYLNLISQTSGGIAFHNFEYSGVVGVKRIIKDGVSMFADLVLLGHGEYALEFALEADFKRGWSLGPGVSLQRSDGGADEFDVSVGISVFKTFGS